jgi:carboxymethylenebutenolidase
MVIMSDTMTAETTRINGHNGDEIEAYLAGPDGPPSRGGVVVIHHLPGYDRGSKEIVRRFAELGYDALCPNLYSREAPGMAPADASALVRERGGVPDDQLVGDVAGAAAQLRSLPTSNQKVGVIGFCSGGRQSVLAACSPDEVSFDAAVDCYGAFVTGTPPEGFPLQINNLVDRIPELSCPLLGLFGNDDKVPSPEHVDELEQLLRQAGKNYEFHRYDGAGHAFFSVETERYRADAAADGWQRIAAFYGNYLRT